MEFRLTSSHCCSTSQYRENGRQGRGLLLVRFIAEQYGGRATSLEPARPGSCFALEIPLTGKQITPALGSYQ